MIYQMPLDTRFATLYVGDKPVATIQRKRVYSKEPNYTVYNIDGEKLFERNFATFLSSELVRRFGSNGEILPF